MTTNTKQLEQRIANRLGDLDTKLDQAAVDAAVGRAADSLRRDRRRVWSSFGAWVMIAVSFLFPAVVAVLLDELAIFTVAGLTFLGGWIGGLFAEQTVGRS